MVINIIHVDDHAFVVIVQTDGEAKTEVQVSPGSAKEAASSNKMVSVSSTGKLVAPVVSSGMTTALELRNPKTSSTGVPQPLAVLSSEAWVQV